MQYIKVEKISPDVHKEQIAALWSRVFGDSREYVRYFIKECKHKTALAVFSGENIASQLFLVDCEVQNVRGKYVYAVCTDEQYRKRGFASLLIQEAKKYTDTFLCLIPADCALKSYYGDMGFSEKFSGSDVRKNILFFENDEITGDLFDGARLDVLTAMFYCKNGGCG